MYVKVIMGYSIKFVTVLMFTCMLSGVSSVWLHFLLLSCLLGGDWMIQSLVLSADQYRWVEDPCKCFGVLFELYISGLLWYSLWPCCSL